MPTRPIRIPKSISTDPPIVTLVTMRRNLLLRYAICAKRVNPFNPKRSAIERARTKERRVLRARIRVIDEELLHVLGRATKHPDLYQGAQHCRRYRLISEWVLLKRPHRPSDPQSAVERRRTRERIATELQDLSHEWLSALTTAVFPDDRLPPRIQQHVRTFVP